MARPERGSSTQRRLTDRRDGYPVVMFHRGTSGYYSRHDVSGAGYDSWLESVAKQCLIVIAPETDEGYRRVQEGQGPALRHELVQSAKELGEA